MRLVRRLSLVLLTLFLLCLTNESKGQNLARQYVRARAYGDTQGMNRAMLNARNPYSSLYRGRNEINVRLYYQYSEPRNFYGRGGYARAPVATSLDRPIYIQGRYGNPNINIYVPGRR